MLGKTMIDVMRKVVRTDGWANVLTGLGMANRDKRISTEFGTIPTLTSHELDQMYQGDWITARACDRPAAEMTRKWIEIKASEAQDEADAVLAAMNSMGAKPAFKLANTWARLHGGCLIVLGIDDGQEMEEPLDESRIRKIEYLRVLDRWDVSVDQHYSSEDGGGLVGEPKTYRINTSVQDDAGNNIGAIVHATRCLRFDGMDTPLRLRVNNDMWTYGIVHRVLPVVRDFWNSWGGAAHLTTDFAQAVFRIKGLAKMLAEDNEQLVIQRLQLVDMARSLVRMVPIDEDEELERKQTPIAGLPDLMRVFEEGLAGALDMPISVLFGKAVAGIGDAGNSQLQQWYDKIANEQETRIVPQATRFAELLALAAEGPTNGQELRGDWSVHPLPLEEMSEKEIAEIHKTQADADKVEIEMGIITAREARESRHGGDEYSTSTTLDKDVSDLLESGPVDPSVMDDPDADPNADPAAPPEADPAAPAETEDEPLDAPQIKAMTDVLIAYNKKTLTQTQAAQVLSNGFGLELGAATALVGEREETPPPPPMIPGQAPPVPPGKPDPEKPEDKPPAPPAPAKDPEADE